MTKDELFEHLSILLKPIGYQKRGNSWSKENMDTTTVLALDRSRWGNLYYIYLCVHFKSLSNEKRLKIHQYHSRFRAELLGEKIDNYFNLEKPMNDKVRFDNIDRIIGKSITFLKSAETIEGFKKLLDQYPLHYFWLKKEAEEYLMTK